jgi:hypothetical protein
VKRTEKAKRSKKDFMFFLDSASLLAYNGSKLPESIALDSGVVFVILEL